MFVCKSERKSSLFGLKCKCSHIKYAFLLCCCCCCCLPLFQREERRAKALVSHLSHPLHQQHHRPPVHRRTQSNQLQADNQSSSFRNAFNWIFWCFFALQLASRAIASSCTICKKHFRSSQAFVEHLQSLEHRQKVEKVPVFNS